MGQAAKDVSGQLPPPAMTAGVHVAAPQRVGCRGCRPPLPPRQPHPQAGRKERGRAGPAAPGRPVDRVLVVLGVVRCDANQGGVTRLSYLLRPHHPAFQVPMVLPSWLRCRFIRILEHGRCVDGWVIYGSPDLVKVLGDLGKSNMADVFVVCWGTSLLPAASDYQSPHATSLPSPPWHAGLGTVGVWC